MTLTVVVPTKNRAETLMHCLKTIVDQDDPRLLQIIVSDNKSEDNTEEVVKSFRDPRLIYLQPPKRLGMSEHWEFALSYVETDWVTVLGDDDGLVPNAVTKLFDIVENQNVKAVSSPKCKYRWPMADGTSSKFKCENRDRTGYEIRRSKEWLRKVLRCKASHKVLPWIYTGGYLHMDVINQAIRKRGRFFNSISPDLCSAITSSLLTEEYAYSFAPLAIGGVSKYSNGLAQTTRTSKNKTLEEFYDESSIKFNPSLGDGFVQSLPLLVYEAYLNSGDLFKDDSLSPSMQEQLVNAIAFSKPGFRKRVRDYCIRVAKNNNLSVSFLFFAYFVTIGKRVIGAFWGRARSILEVKTPDKDFRKSEKGWEVGRYQNVYEAYLSMQ